MRPFQKYIFTEQMLMYIQTKIVESDAWNYY